MAGLPAIVQAFEELTGWSLHYHCGTKPIHRNQPTWSAPADPGVGTAPGHVRLDLVRSASAASDRIAPPAVRRFASAFEALLGDLIKTREALWQREAELAAAVPVVARPDEQANLAARLQAILRGGAEAVGCQAAALYLLDEATTTLKLRASWGLPRQRLTDPPRPLRGALADLEAMLGHAVVLEDTAMFQQWNPPEDFPSAACVPVATPTTILGTLWVFCAARRDFNDRETSTLEMVAGRLASDLERAILLQEGVSGVRLKRQLEAAQRIQRNQLPSVAPILRGWELAGWTSLGPTLSWSFHDWFSVPKGQVVFAVGQAAGSGIEAALVAHTLKAALRSHGQYHRRIERLLSRINLTLWTGSAGDQSASLLCGFIEPDSDQVRYSAAGQLGVVQLGPHAAQSVPCTGPALGESPESRYTQTVCRLQPGHVLVVLSEGFMEALTGESTMEKQHALAAALTPRLGLPAKHLLSVAKGCLRQESNAAGPANQTLLILKRSGS